MTAVQAKETGDRREQTADDEPKGRIGRSAGQCAANGSIVGMIGAGAQRKQHQSDHHKNRCNLSIHKYAFRFSSAFILAYAMPRSSRCRSRRFPAVLLGIRAKSGINCHFVGRAKCNKSCNFSRSSGSPIFILNITSTTTVNMHEALFMRVGDARIARCGRFLNLLGATFICHPKIFLWTIGG
jgi:hypothetical protein